MNKWILLAVSILPLIFGLPFITPENVYVVTGILLLITSSIMIWAVWKKYGTIWFWLISYELTLSLIYIIELGSRHRNPFSFDNIGPLLACWGIAGLTLVIYLIKGKSRRSLLLAGAIVCLMISVAGLYFTRK